MEQCLESGDGGVMKPSQRCMEIVKEFESFEAKPYKCPAGVWTIGYGHTKGVTESSRPVTHGEAELLLAEDLMAAADIIERNVHVPLTQGQYDALCSFIFNVGPGGKGVKDGFVRLKSGEHSTMYKKLEAGNYKGAGDEFLKWTKAGGRVLGGLVKRRATEKMVFET